MNNGTNGEITKQRILAIDDEPDLLRLIQRIISEMTPYEIITTNNSLEVHKILESEVFDLILLDLKMPGLSGMEILKLLKQQKRKEQVIIFTAFGSLETAVEATTLGIFDYITKPFKKDRILTSVNNAMRLQKALQQAETLNEIFATVPFAEASTLFNREYIRRLAKRYGGNMQKMAEASGIGIEKIKAELEK